VDLRPASDPQIIGFGGDPRKTIYLLRQTKIWVDDGDATCKRFSRDTYELVKNIR